MAKKRSTKKKTSRKETANADSKPRTKSQLFSEIADRTGLTKRDVSLVFDEVVDLIRADLSRRGPGAFTLPGLVKITKIHKPRRAARKGVNPFTGEEMMFKAKPAHNVVKVRALKSLKDMV